MLRIKESEWQRFCDNAEKYGLYNTYDLYVKYNDDNICIMEVRKDYIYIDSGVYGDAIDILFDLIQQGYVEKVEE